jgi:hypothetical protein
MPYYEDDIRAAFHSLAAPAPDADTVLTRLQEQLDSSGTPGHQQPFGRSRFTARMLIPLAAAAAVVAVIATSVAITSGDHARQVAPAVSPLLRQVPPYYMYVPMPSCSLTPVHKLSGAAKKALLPEKYCTSAQLAAVIGSTATGARVGSVLPPKSAYFTSVSGARDDRTFALAATPRSWTWPKSCAKSMQNPTCWPPNKVYIARFDPADGAVTLRVLPIPAIKTPGGVILALSPSGTELAVARGGIAGEPVLQVDVYSLTSNTVKVWQDPGLPFGLAWGPNGQLGISWWHSNEASGGISMLNTNTAGGSLLAASRRVVTSRQPGHRAIAGERPFAVSADGRVVVTPVIRDGSILGDIGWFSVATGRETRAYWPWPADVPEEDVAWTNSSGKVSVVFQDGSLKGDITAPVGVLSGHELVAVPRVTGFWAIAF